MAMLRQVVVLVLVGVVVVVGAASLSQGQAASPTKLLAEAVAMYSLEAGWPQDLGAAVSSPALADVNGDGLLEVILASGDGAVSVWRHDGTLLPGWPQATGGPICAFSAVAVGDLDGDGAPEIVVASGDGLLYAWQADGSALPGWPVSALGASGGWGETTSPSLADVDGDGLPEVVLAANGLLRAWNADGSPWGYAMGAGAGGLRSLSVGDIDRDRWLELLVGAEVFRHDGSTLTTWPDWGSPWTHAPVLADVDQDGQLEAVAADAQGAVGVTRLDGSVPEGWPVQTGEWLSELAIADLDGDGAPEIVAQGCEGQVYAWKADGSALSGWPVQAESGYCTAPVIGDIDEDGQQEVVLAAGQLWAWHGDGSVVAGFPIASLDTTCHGPTPQAAPALGDIDNDGQCELVVGGTREVAVWKVAPQGDLPATRARLSWRMLKHDPARSGSYYTFDDVPTTMWAWPQIETAVQQGILRGYATTVDYLCRPELEARRDAVAVALYRALEMYESEQGASLMAMGATTTGTASASTYPWEGFQDVPKSSWAYSAITALSGLGIVQGFSHWGDWSPFRYYLPTNSSTRAQIAVFLTRALHLDTKHPPITQSFVDVPRGYWAYADIEAVKAAGIALGYGSGSEATFGPSQTLHRDQLAVFLVRAFLPPLAAARAPDAAVTPRKPRAAADAAAPGPAARAPGAAPGPGSARGPLTLALASSPAASPYPVTMAGRASEAIAPNAIADYEQTAFPSQMGFGIWYEATVTMRNTGLDTWTKADGYRLVCRNDPADLWTTTEVALDDADIVAPGQEKTFHFLMRATLAGGPYTPQWSMAVGDTLFGEVTYQPLALAVGACTPAVSEQEVIYRSTPRDHPGIVPSPLFRYDLSTGATTQITPGDTMDNSPEISGDRVAYQSWYADGHYDISVLDLGTGVIQHYDANGTAWQPDIEGQYVVWTAVDAASQTHLFLLDTGTQQVTDLDQDVGLSRIDGGRVAYVKRSANLLRIYDIAQGKVTQEFPCTGSEVDISGNQVAALCDGTVTLIDLSTGTQTQLTGASGHQLRLVNGRIVWTECCSVAFYDIATGTRTTLTGGDCHQPGIAAQTVVWGQCWTATPTVYLLRSLPQTISVTGPGAVVVREQTAFPTTMSVGFWYDATVTMRNTGPDTWTKADGYHLISCDRDLWTTMEVPLDDADAIAPGQMKTFHFQMRGPGGAGLYYPAWSMAAGDLTFGEVTSQPRALATGACTPAVSEHEVIYRSTPSDHPPFFTPTPLFRYDLSTGATTQITRGDTTDSYPEISGGRVAYLSWFPDGRYAVSVLDLSTGAIQHFDATRLPNIPDIDGGYVVWSSNDSDSENDLFLLDLSTQQATVLDHGVGLSRIDAGRIAYVKPSTGLLCIYDIAQGRVTHEFPCTGSSLDISGNQVAAICDGSLTLFDLGTGMQTQLTGASGNGVKFSDGRIVWDECCSVVLYDIATATPAILTGGDCHQPGIAGQTVVWDQCWVPHPTVYLGSVPVLVIGPNAVVVPERTAFPTPMTVGQWYEAMVTMRNTGPDTWTKADGYHLVSRDGGLWTTAEVPLDEADAIGPGQEKTFHFSVRAPVLSGTYAPAWSMAVAGMAFGEVTNQPVTVSAVDPAAVGLYVPANAALYLRASNDPTAADVDVAYAPSTGEKQIPLAGDWDGDGLDGIGLYDPASGTFFLRNANTPGPPDLSFTCGPADSTWLPVAGDFDGDGIDSIGLYDPATGLWFLRNSNSAGEPDIAFNYGPANCGWQPVMGDWNGDGIDTVGLYDAAFGRWLPRDSNSTGFADHGGNYAYHETYWGPGGAAGKAVVGNWNGDGFDSLGLYDSVRGLFYLRGEGGRADTVVPYGTGGIGPVPVAGRWQ